ncbi:MAG: TatD family hydrolase [Clostridia bacterium]|nr:TatD family hydrolase [Clostridia bacterium]
MKLYDSHAHYNDEKFADCRDTLLDEILSGGEVQRILNAGTDIRTSRECVDLCRRYEAFVCAVGIHPHECGDVPDKNAALDEVRRMLEYEKAVAIGEIGLDYHYDFSERSVQKDYFDAQMSLSEELGLPVVIHDREAHGDTFDMIKAHPNAFGVMHSYSGSAEQARQLVSLGWYISFSGSVTFKNAHNLREAVTVVPDDRILVETDCPYLAPVPVRGSLNDSVKMKHTVGVLAEIRGEDPAKTAEITYENAVRLFGK